ncbi:unnamed protein product [Paramecium sonneborni]|uniref:Uncharacterized protein n=1 Tax=Paramecium sonneborni TaxID=65129 RepID=A0A8S1P5S0_9CILI|nr:unnamed protein product [Paramecium sonneborni]
MGKQPQPKNFQVQNNENYSITKKKFRGRPPKPPQTKEPYQDQKICWFSADESRKIIEILGTKCQILYKCLSGKSANNFKNKIWSSANNQISFNDFKSFRQEFAKQMTELQNKLLIKLQEYFQIELVDGDKQMDYFFFQNNTKKELNDTTTSNQSNTFLDLLLPYIHIDFICTLQELIQIYNQPQNLDCQQQISQNRDLYNISKDSKHKHLGCWAFICAWGKDAKDHIKKLQKIDDIPENQQPDQPISLIELKEQSEKILEKKEKEININIENLIQAYQQELEKEIDDLVDQFRQGLGRQTN